MSKTGVHPYYHGQHRWDNYLLDIQSAVEKNSNILHEQTEELQEQTEELRFQTQELGNIRANIEGMREEMEWGFMLIAERMDRQTELFSKALEKLDEIQKTLKSPLMTQAWELFELGEQRLRQGLLDKALDVYLQSEQKNEVNFLLQRRLGMLFLEGINSECNVIDFAKAEQHLLLAARYAQASEKIEPNWKYFCAEAYYRAGNAAYLMGEQCTQVSDIEGMHRCLNRSLEYLSKALALRPDFTQCLYSQAKCHALLGQESKALEIFRALSDRNRNYSEILQDKDFDRIRADIKKIFESALDCPGHLALSMQKSLSRAQKTLAWVTRSQANVTQFASYLSNIQQLLGTLDVNLEILNRGLNRKQFKMEQVIIESYQGRLKSIESEINAVVSNRSEPEQAIKNLQQAMAQNKGTRMGLLFAALTYLVLFSLVSMLANFFLNPMVQEHKFTPLTGPLTFLAITIPMLAIIVASFFFGRSISRSRKNQPFQEGIQHQLTRVEACNSRISILSQRLEAIQKEQQEFTSWREDRKAAAQSAS